MDSYLSATRRAALVGTTAGAAVVGLSELSPAGATAQRSRDRQIQRQIDRVLVGRKSANGWQMERGSDIGGRIWTRPLPGTGGDVEVCAGDVEAVLVRVVRRFHYEVHPLEAGDVVGYRRPARSSRGMESNHASGTAIDILPGSFPSGVRRGLTADQASAVREIVRSCEGVVVWGGDATVPAESHFHIAVPPHDSRLSRLAATIRREDELPGSGVGVLG